MLSGKALIVVCTIYAHVAINVLAEVFANLGENSLIAAVPHDAIGEVGVHARTVPIQFAEWLWMIVDGIAVFFASSF